ncbi:MAG: hypothetical protein ACYTEQ_27315 [Planctomycetota bacterium]|jgi:hypothetical protein
MTKITSEARSAALSIRAKLRKALAVDDFDLTAAEQKQLNAAIARITKAITPVKKAKAEKKAKPAKAKAKAKTSTKKAPVKKAA